MLVSLSNIHKYYNGREILHGVNLTINEGERIGLVGANGCGKTTFLRILTGKEEPDRFVEDDGVISRASKTTVGYLEQMGGAGAQQYGVCGNAQRLCGGIAGGRPDAGAGGADARRSGCSVRRIQPAYRLF